jgi:hypothetical protein
MFKDVQSYKNALEMVIEAFGKIVLGTNMVRNSASRMPRRRWLLFARGAGEVRCNALNRT